MGFRVAPPTLTLSASCGLISCAMLRGPNVQAQGDSGYNDLGDPPRPNSQESRVTGMSRLSDFTRATGWKSRASLGSGSSVSSELLKELLESNLALKEEFGNLKSEMMRTTNRCPPNKHTRA